ncbi:MAG: hypothetical protein U1D69_12455, partial [Polynucleobacter sp.]|nr:hypothetical protein [Polynucleobacter sp.]
MPLPLSQKDFDGHLQKLRQILKNRAVGRQSDVFEFGATVSRGSNIDVHLKRNASTEQAVNDFDHEVTCAVLCIFGSRKILFSYYETWKQVSKTRYQFLQASNKFFLAYDRGEIGERRQIFRLEWENWQLSETPNKAAYPHWQFDRWLTGSDAQTREEIRASFQEQAGEMVFDTAEAQARSERPNLGWFTKVHFPVSAQWAKDKIKSLDDLVQPHRLMPESADELENWLDSALYYVANEVNVYA